MSGRRILAVTYYYPPDTSIGGRRWHAMARCLRESGHEVTILTTDAWGSDPADSAGVIRSPDLVAVTQLRRLFGRPDLPRPGRAVSLQTAAPTMLTDGLVPDTYLATWVVRAALTARRLVKEREIDCVVTSGPPHSVHILGLLLGEARPAWIADFRDGWTFEPPREPWPTRTQERVDAWLERRVVNAADVVVGVTRPIVDDLRSRLEASASLVTNGWDPPAVIGVGGSKAKLDPRTFNLVHTGLLSAEGGRDPRALFGAMRDLQESEDHRGERIRLVLAGRLSEADLQILATAPSNVSHVGHLSPSETVALQREADALVLLTAVGRRSEATGKLFEYLQSGRPIIALAEKNEAARIVAETRTGITIPADDRAAITDSLMAAVDGRLADAYEPADLGRYVYPAPAHQFAAEVDRAIGLASQGNAAVDPDRPSGKRRPG